jgi:hypothetical protein
MSGKSRLQLDGFGRVGNDPGELSALLEAEGSCSSIAGLATLRLDKAFSRGL